MPNTANVAFPGDDCKTAYFCTPTNLGSLQGCGVRLPVANKVGFRRDARGWTNQLDQQSESR
jgi:hypothetical protein